MGNLGKSMSLLYELSWPCLLTTALQTASADLVAERPGEGRL